MRDSKHKISLTIALGIVLILGIVLLFKLRERKVMINSSSDYKNAEYVIDGERIKLENGVAETETAPGYVSKIITRYFGNELQTDLNNDEREDIVFLLTQETGGSGVFYYAVSALNTKDGYIGSDGYLLGDRIAPQTTELSQNPRHKNVVVVNYADRAPGEPMTAEPSVGKSVYLKLDLGSMQWGVVIPDFEGESTIPEPIAESWGRIIGMVMLGPICPVVREPPDPQCSDRPYKTNLVLTSADQSKFVKTFSSDASGKFSVQIQPGEYTIRSAATTNILPYCSSSNTIIVTANSYTETTVHCDTGIR